MGYFDDIEFLAGAFLENCRAQMDRRFSGTYSLEFLLSGHMRCSIDSSPSTIISKPCFFWHHPAHRYKYGACDLKGWDHHWLLMRGERARKILEEALMPEFPSGFAPVASPELFHEDFHRLLDLALAPDRPQRPEAVALLETMLARLLATVRVERTESSFEEIFVRIRQNPAKDWDFKRLATQNGMSYGHFRRRFKELSGRAPHDFVLQCRVGLAAELLLSQSAAIKEVASTVSCPDQASFSKLFKTRFGVSPKEYRSLIPTGLSEG